MDTCSVRGDTVSQTNVLSFARINVIYLPPNWGVNCPPWPPVPYAYVHYSWIFSATLWMDTGTTNGKNWRYVNLSAVAMSIGSKMCQALTAYHAFKGTDFTSAIIRIIPVLFFVIVLAVPLNDQAFTSSWQKLVGYGLKLFELNRMIGTCRPI